MNTNTNRQKLDVLFSFYRRIIFFERSNTLFKPAPESKIIYIYKHHPKLFFFKNIFNIVNSRNNSLNIHFSIIGWVSSSLQKLYNVIWSGL